MCAWGLDLFTRDLFTRLRRNRRLLILLVLGALLLLCMLIAVSLGAVPISPLNIIKMVLDKIGLFHFSATWQPSDETILFVIRLPRVVAGALVGAALASAGVLFQGMLRNPMADPYIIGTSAGAAFGATMAMMSSPGLP